MTTILKSEPGFGARGAVVLSMLIAAVAILVFYAHPLQRFVHEAFMQRVTSAHYEILCPTGALSQQAMTQFAAQRESVFTMLDHKLNDAGSNSKLRVIFSMESPAPATDASGSQPYSVTGTTIRTTLTGSTPELDPSADAQALLYIAWGRPGNPQMARWAAMALVGEWRGQDLGMAAAGIEQTIGHKKLTSLFDARSGGISSPNDRAVLGAAWITEIVDFGGPSAVRKLYSAMLSDFNETEAAKILGTTPAELDRKWQLWMYAYLAGMPSASQSTPMNMEMRSQ